jgi:N-acetylglucosaminyl-diphospho-decaprenol L-rhamnosyltransferase
MKESTPCLFYINIDAQSLPREGSFIMSHCMASRTTAIIVNWNGSSYLERLILSLKNASPEAIFVVDNASTDQSLQILSKLNEVTVIRNDRNLGFGTAANQAIARVETPYLLLLNSDIEVKRDSMQILERFLEEHPDTGIVAPQLLFFDGALQLSCRTFPTVWKLFLYLSYLDHLIPSGYRLNMKQHQTASEVEQPMGAAMMVRKLSLDQVGLFDERFFLYMEDVDLCERLVQGGWKIWYLPEAKMKHQAGGSANQDWERSQTNFLQSVIRYFQKKNPGSGILFTRIALSIALIIRALILTIRMSFKKASFYFRMSLRILWLT